VFKLLYTASSFNREERQYILQVISAYQHLSHPSILPVLAAGFYQDVPYVMTEYVPSGSLHDYLSDESATLQQEQIFSLIAQIGQALTYVHQQRRIHGNLKPQNVLLSAQNEALLTDFALFPLPPPDQGENIDDVSIYRAPEQLDGHADEKSDQYALGCIAYELLTGHKPFLVPSVTTPGAWYKTHSLIAPGQLDSAISVSVEKALLTALSKEPDQRHHSIPAFLTALGVSSPPKERTTMWLPEVHTDPDPHLDPERQITAGHDNLLLNLATMQPPLDPLTPLPTSLTGPISDPFTAEALRRFSSPGLQSPLDTPLPYGVKTGTLLQQTKQKFTLKRRRILIAMMCLVILTMLSDFLLSAFNVSAPAQKVLPPAAEIIATMQIIAQNTTSAATAGTTVQTVPTTGQTGTTQASATQTPASGPTTLNQSTPTSVTGSTPTSSTITSTPTPTPAPVPVQVSLTSFFNNEGIGSYPGEANFDGSGYSYPAGLVPSAGLVTVQGITYRFPSNARGTGDNVIVAGQTIALTQKNYSHIYLLASSSWGPVTDTITIKDTDGTSTTATITVEDWVTGTASGLSMAYRYGPVGIVRNTIHIFAISITLSSAHTVSSLYLARSSKGPTSGETGEMHLFALTLQP
jgi:serine/threonine protein kinase